MQISGISIQRAREIIIQYLLVERYEDDEEAIRDGYGRAWAGMPPYIHYERFELEQMTDDELDKLAVDNGMYAG